jgi:mgtE-like transporter
VFVGFYGAVAAYRLGLDPDNHGIPIVTSSLDLLGAVALILVIVALGLT